MLKLAAWYEIGKGKGNDYPVKKDLSASHMWHTKAAELGNPEACYVVASSYYHGTHNLTKGKYFT
jgi:TPR repeat protein